MRTDCFAADGTHLWTTSATYNAFHLLSETDALGYVTHYLHDAFGHKVAMAKGAQKTRWEYDALGRVAKTIIEASDTDTLIQAYSYDLLNRVIEERSEDAQAHIRTRVQYAFEPQGISSQVITWGEVGMQVTQTRYNSYGVPYETINALGEKTVTQIHFNHRNALGQLVPCQESIDPLGNATITIKDALGREVLLMRRNTLGETIQKQEIFYDGAGNRARIVETIYAPNSPERQVTQRWEYDCMQRCTAYIQAANSPEQKRTSYSYNTLGQLTHLIKPSGITLLHTYNRQGLLETYRAEAISFCYRYTYDQKMRPILH